jgi:hypothetical protein
MQSHRISEEQMKSVIDQLFDLQATTVSIKNAKGEDVSFGCKKHWKE